VLVVPQTFAVSARSAASPERVFALLADGAGWSRWAGPLILRSWWEREGDPPPGGVGAVRRLGAKQFASREEIVAYEPPGHLAYTILSGQPVRDYRADVRLEPDGRGTRIVWSATFEPLVPGTGTAMRWWFTRLVGGFARRLAQHAELSG
jgi:uncharacterized protein YndB with AHSA1/START domain